MSNALIRSAELRSAQYVSLGKLCHAIGWRILSP